MVARPGAADRRARRVIGRYVLPAYTVVLCVLVIELAEWLAIR